MNYSENICFVISKLWVERDKHTNNDYDVTCWMGRMFSMIQIETIGIGWTLSSRPCFLIRLRKIWMKLLILFGVNILISIIILIFLTITNLSGVANISMIVIVICGRKNTLYHAPKPLVSYLAEKIQNFFGYDI